MVELGAVLVVPLVLPVLGVVLVFPLVPMVPLIPLVPVVELEGGVVVVDEVPAVPLPVVVPETGAGTIPAGHGLETVALALRLPGEVELVELAEVPLLAVEEVVAPTCDEPEPTWLLPEPVWLLPLPTWLLLEPT